MKLGFYGLRILNKGLVLVSRLEDSPIVFLANVSPYKLRGKHLNQDFCAFLRHQQLVGFALELSPHVSVFTSTDIFSLKEN